MDAAAGNKQDPRSLHKYLYVANNPVGFVDPSGLSFLDKILPKSWQSFARNVSIRTAVLLYVGQQAHRKIMEFYKEEHFENKVRFNSPIFSVLGIGSDYNTDLNIKLRPDIADISTKEVYEIKSIWLRALGFVINDATRQVNPYISILNDTLAGNSPPANSMEIWHAGTAWNVDEILSLDTVLPIRIHIYQASPGVIVYSPMAEFYAYWALGEIVPKFVRAVQISYEIEAEEAVIY